jgi:hypothetical protein
VTTANDLLMAEATASSSLISTEFLLGGVELQAVPGNHALKRQRLPTVGIVHFRPRPDDEHRVVHWLQVRSLELARLV